MLITIICILLAVIVVGCYNHYKAVSSLSHQNKQLTSRNECLEENLKGRNAEIDTLEKRWVKLHQENIRCNDSWMEQHKMHEQMVRLQQETMKDLQQVMAMNRAINKVLQEENKVNKNLRSTIEKIEKVKNSYKIQNNPN
jgi:Tfp pilus assembly protein PilE